MPYAVYNFLQAGGIYAIVFGMFGVLGLSVIVMLLCSGWGGEEG